MSTQFQSIIEAGVRRAKARKSVIWADEFARRIVSSTPLTVRESEISDLIAQAATRAGVAIEFARQQDALKGGSRSTAC